MIISYMGRNHSCESRIQFIKSVRAVTPEQEFLENNAYRLKTLTQVYDKEAMKLNGMVELILPSCDLENGKAIINLVKNITDYSDKVVLIHYPREIELILMPMLYIVAKAVIARTNSVLNQGICVYSDDNDWEIGKSYNW